MKRIPIQGNHGVRGSALVDDADFDRLSAYRWHLSGDGYAQTKGIGFMHRLIAQPGPGRVVDHRNHDRLDNRRSNLRTCTPAQNAANRRHKSMQYKGVCRAGGGYFRAVIGGRDLGKYPSREAAALAWNAAAIERYGEFACLNEVAQ